MWATHMSPSHHMCVFSNKDAGESRTYIVVEFRVLRGDDQTDQMIEPLCLASLNEAVSGAFWRLTETRQLLTCLQFILGPSWHKSLVVVFRAHYCRWLELQRRPVLTTCRLLQRIKSRCYGGSSSFADRRHELGQKRLKKAYSRSEDAPQTVDGSQLPLWLLSELPAPWQRSTWSSR